MDEGFIYEDPLAELKVEKPKQKKEIVNKMTFAEYEAIVCNAENKKSYYLPAIMFLAETGLRVEELAIKKADYRLTENGTAYVIINKSVVRALTDDDATTELRLMDNVKSDASERKVPLNIFAQNAIENQLAYCQEHEIRSPFIFCTKTGAMLDQRNLLRALHMMCVNAEIPKRGLHSLRKLFINHTLRQGITPFDLAKVTGHSMQTMFRYYHDLDDELLAKIADASENR
jgi:integrase